ncbi:acyl-CoA carboxylase epsilon subunit [Streptacidiphilus sp. PAMC 29251]
MTSVPASTTRGLPEPAADTPEVVFRIEYGRPDADDLAALALVLLSIGARSVAGPRTRRRRRRAAWVHLPDYRVPGSWE